jgi:hypothetical protein
MFDNLFIVFSGTFPAIRLLNQLIQVDARIVAAGCAMFFLMAVPSAMALTIDYSYRAFPTISSWGTMDINVADISRLSVLYTAADNLSVNTLRLRHLVFRRRTKASIYIRSCRN